MAEGIIPGFSKPVIQVTHMKQFCDGKLVFFSKFARHVGILVKDCNTGDYFIISFQQQRRKDSDPS